MAGTLNAKVEPMSEHSLPPAAPTPGPAPTVAVPGGAKNSTLGLVALITAAVGAVFACIPGAMIVGWVLLPIAFILALVSLFQKGKKTFGVVALILSIVGTIIGVIVFMTVVSGAVNDALGGSEVAIAQSVDETEQEAGDEDTGTNEPEADAAVGTRDNPVALGTLLETDKWAVTIDSVNLDGNQAVADANEFNDPPADGHKYIVVQLTATNRAAEPAYDSEVQVAFVSDSGEVFNSFDAMAVAPEPMFGLNELYEGGSSTGNLVIQVPVDGAGLLRVTPGLLADEVFVKTS